MGKSLHLARLNRIAVIFNCRCWPVFREIDEYSYLFHGINPVFHILLDWNGAIFAASTDAELSHALSIPCCTACSTETELSFAASTDVDLFFTASIPGSAGFSGEYLFQARKIDVQLLHCRDCTSKSSGWVSTPKRMQPHFWVTRRILSYSTHRNKRKINSKLG